MIDCCAQRFEVSASAADLAAMFNVATAFSGSDLREHFAAPVFVQSADASLKFRLIDHLRSAILQVDRKHIGDVDSVDIPSVACGLVLFCDVGG